MIKKILKAVFISFIAVISVIGILVTIVSLIFFKIVTKDDRMSKQDIFNYVIQNREVIEISIRDFVNQNHDIGVADIRHNLQLSLHESVQTVGIKDGKTVRFDCGGYGMGSATGYVGFYYLLSGEKLGQDMSALGYSGITFIPYGDGWLYHEENGDNTVYIENIAGSFYYYSEEY